jgi:hypothetical protein
VAQNTSFTSSSRSRRLSEHSSPRVEIANGQSQTLARMQPRNYTKSLQLKHEFPFYDLIPGQIDEGYSLEISPLLSLDRQTMETAVTCRVDQVEKLVPLAIDVPVGAQSQRVQIQVPQMASWRLSERFRWPASDVLLLVWGRGQSCARRDGGARAAGTSRRLQQPGRCPADDRRQASQRHHARRSSRSACSSTLRRYANSQAKLDRSRPECHYPAGESHQPRTVLKQRRNVARNTNVADFLPAARASA